MFLVCSSSITPSWASRDNCSTADETDAASGGSFPQNLHGIRTDGQPQRGGPFLNEATDSARIKSWSAHIQRFFSANSRQRNFVRCGGSLGCPFSQTLSRKKTGSMPGRGTPSTAESFFQTSEESSWALRINRFFLVPPRPCRVKASQNPPSSPSSAQNMLRGASPCPQADNILRGMLTREHAVWTNTEIKPWSVHRMTTTPTVLPPHTDSADRNTDVPDGINIHAERHQNFSCMRSTARRTTSRSSSLMAVCSRWFSKFSE